MKKYFIILLLSLCLSGCMFTTDSKDEFNKALNDLFDSGFSSGVDCMGKFNNAEKCMDILKTAREKLNDSKN